MKITLGQKTAGVVLMVALFVIVAVGIMLAAYLTLMSGETRTTARSQVWNNCVPVMEAGVEEAMAQIYYCNGTTNYGSNNWTLTSSNYYTKTRAVGTNGSYCVVRLQQALNPLIYSTAYVPVSDSSTNYITRTVRVSVNQQPAMGGLAAKRFISLSGAGYFDSFNSSIAPYNSSVHGTNAAAITDSSASGAISNGVAIYGMAITGAGGTVVNRGTISGGTLNDANMQINDPVMPSSLSNASSPLPGTILGVIFPSYTLNNSDYKYVGNLSITPSSGAVGVYGNCRLYVTGNLSINGKGAEFELFPGATLALYVGGTISIGGNGIVNNNTSNVCASVSIYGLNTCTNISFTGNSSFYGTVNAPEANLNFGGTIDYFGEFTANNIVVSGNCKIHYDESLGVAKPMIATSWNEL